MPDFDPDRLVNALQTRTAEEWGAYVTRLRGGNERAVTLYDVIMDAYNEQAVAVHEA
jgi:hypothetical protein